MVKSAIQVGGNHLQFSGFLDDEGSTIKPLLSQGAFEWKILNFCSYFRRFDHYISPFHSINRPFRCARKSRFPAAVPCGLERTTAGAAYPGATRRDPKVPDFDIRKAIVCSCFFLFFDFKNFRLSIKGWHFCLGLFALTYNCLPTCWLFTAQRQAFITGAGARVDHGLPG